MYRDTDDIEDVKSRLNELDLQIDKDVKLARKLLKQVVHATSCGIDMSQVFYLVIKLMAGNDLITKKLASWYIAQHANHDGILLVISMLTKDCQDPNPMFRAFGLKTFSSIGRPELVEYQTGPISNGLKDSSAYVRRAAVTSCAKVHQINPDIVLEKGWIDILYSMIRDSDPVVVTNCISVLEELLQKEGGMVVTRQMAHHLLNKLAAFKDWHLVIVLRLLKRYKPRTEEEALDIMNIADDHLKSNDATVVLETLQFFLCLIRQMPHLESELYKRAAQQIHQFLGSGNHELIYVLLEIIENLTKKNCNFSGYYKSFFCKYNDPIFLKEKKIHMLPCLLTSGNVKEMLEELNMYSLDVASTVAKQSIQAIGIIASSMPEYLTGCLEKLLVRLKAHPQGVTDELLIVLQTLDLREAVDMKKALETIKCAGDHIETELGHAALVTVLGDYGDHLEESPYIIEEYIQRLEEESSEVLALALLTATSKLFLKRPAEVQEMLGSLMEMCMQCKSVTIRDRVVFCYQLLKTDPVQATKVICNDLQLSRCM